MRRVILGMAIGLPLAGGLPAGAVTMPEVEQPWARATATGQANGAAYLTIRNGEAADRLTGAASSVAEHAELHEHTVDGQGIARMRPVAAVDLSAGEVVRLQPGGMHIMLVGLKEPLVQGTSFPLTLEFERAGPVKVAVQVESVRGMKNAAQDHGHGMRH